MKLLGCLFFVLSLNVALADGVVTISVPEGQQVTLEEAFTESFVEGAADYAGLLKADDLIVAGAGRLVIDKDLKTSGYKGEVHVKKGATLRITVSGALGDTAKGTFVENGATLETLADADNSLSFRDEPLAFAGTGVDGQGALVSLSESNQRQGAWGGTVLTMTGDAMIRVATTKMSDFPIQSIKNNETIDMNGYTLTFCGPGTSTYGTLPLRMNVVNPGHIVVSNKLTLSINDSNNLGGSSENTLTIGKTARLDLYGSNTEGKKNWTLVVPEDAQDNAIVSSAGGVWDGPIKRSDGKRVFLAMATDNSAGNRTVFRERVDIEGDFIVTNNTKSANGNYPRPFLALHGNGSRIGGKTSLMEVDAEFGETSPNVKNIELYKSCLSLKNRKYRMDELGNAGLWKGSKGFSEWAEAMAFFKGTECITNSAALGPDDAMTATAEQYGEHTVVTYSGYIWNNDYATSSRVITFVNAAKTASDISIIKSSDGNKLSVSDVLETGKPENYQGDKRCTITGMRLEPGPHKIEIRLSIYGGNGGPNGKFPGDYGIMYRWGSSTYTSTDPNDYLPLMDSGDGTLFTRTILGSAEYDALGFGGETQFLPLQSVSGDEDSSLVLSGRYSIETVKGPFHVVNNALPGCLASIFSVSERIECEAQDVVSGRHLVVTGALDFADGCTVSIQPGFKDIPAGDGYVIAESTESILGLPTLETATGPREVTISVSEDRKRLLMKVKTFGTVISVR